MCSSLLGLVLTVLIAAPLAGETWYVRPDGGTRYSANMGRGQCDGKADAPYPGHGVNQHCAFKDYRYLYDDQSYGDWSKGRWAIAGGDTVILRGGPWRVGFDQGASSRDKWCFGGNGNNACTNPTIPAGTPERHTRILGENYAHCTATNKTQIFGGYGVWETLNLDGAQYVDVECLELTSHARCIVHGVPAYPRGCRTSYPVDDYDSDGITTDVHTHDVLLQDLWIHGHTDRGVKGPIGGTVTCERCDIAYNGMAGWDFDNGRSTASVNGVWNFKDSIIEWSGCNQQYGSNGAASCYGQSSAGYGDGVGTPPGMCLTANIDHSIFRYNTQDGLDLGHIDRGTCSLTVTNSSAYGNSGGALKWGANENPAVLENNTVVANCTRLSAPMTGQPSTYNQHLGDFCRAGDAISFNFRQGGTATLINNTVVTYAPVSFDISCWDKGGCSDSRLVFRNNIVLGYDNPATYSLGGKQGGPGGFYFQQRIGYIERSNNLFYRIQGIRCPTGHPGELCTDPKFVNQPRFSGEQDLDHFDFHLSGTSPALRSGMRIEDEHTDSAGKPRPASGGFDMGAYQD